MVGEERAEVYRQTHRPPAFVEWPVEEFFNELKSRVSKKGRAPNLRTLKMRIRQECRDPSMFEWLTATWATMDERMQDVIDASVGHTQY